MTESFSEEAIRPSALMEAKKDAVDRDRRFLLDRRSDFVHVACPACGREAGVSKWEKLGFEYSVCVSCDTLYMDPRPSQDVLRDFYAASSNYEHWNRSVFPATEPARREAIFRPRALALVDKAEELGLTGGTLLEVGAAFGTFLEEVRSLTSFKRLIAVEPTPDLAATCRSRGFETYESLIEDLALADGADPDVIVAFEVIEHLFDPGAFLATCRALLREGGLAYLSCPNWHGFDVSTLGTLSNTIDHEHLNYFHPRSLSHLLEECSFSVESVETPGVLDAELVRKHVLTGSVDVSEQPLLQRILVDDWDRLHRPFQEFLSQNGLSSHMRIAAVAR